MNVSTCVYSQDEARVCAPGDLLTQVFQCVRCGNVPGGEGGGHVDEICGRGRAVLVCRAEAKATMSSRSLESQGILVAKSQQKTDRILKH